MTTKTTKPNVLVEDKTVVGPSPMRIVPDGRTYQFTDYLPPKPRPCPRLRRLRRRSATAWLILAVLGLVAIVAIASRAGAI